MVNTMWHNTFRGFVGLAAIAVVASPAAAQRAEVVGYSVSTSSRQATITFHLTDGATLPVGLVGGTVRIGGAVVGGYAPGGQLESQWRTFLSQSAVLSTAELVEAAYNWAPDGLGDGDRESAGMLRELFAQLRATAVPPVPEVPEVPEVPPVPQIAGVGEGSGAGAIVGKITDEVVVATELASRIAEAVAGATEARERAVEASALRDQIRNTVRTRVRNDVRDRAQVTFGEKELRSVRATGPVEAAWHGLLGILGTFVALMGLGFGVSFFADRQLDVMADTVQNSFGRSFIVGLFAQPLILPVFAAMLVGLTLTVIGVLVIPVAIIAFVAALAAAVAGGYLAVARVAGAKFLARKQQDYGVEGVGMLRSLAYGISILLAIWLPAVLLGSAPVAGSILTWTAVAATWGLATTGFGAAILTRGGLRGTFGQRFAPRPIAPDHVFAEPLDDPLTNEVDTAEWLAEGKRK